MKNSKVILYEWKHDLLGPQDYYDIDWPMVHKACGLDHIEWINRQLETDCQLNLELLTKGRRLVVEFFNPEIETRYHLMWAK